MMNIYMLLKILLLKKAIYDLDMSYYSIQNYENEGVNLLRQLSRVYELYKKDIVKEPILKEIISLLSFHDKEININFEENISFINFTKDKEVLDKLNLVVELDKNEKGYLVKITNKNSVYFDYEFDSVYLKMFYLEYMEKIKNIFYIHKLTKEEELLL